METTKRYVWLKPDGCFSDSWNEEKHKKHQYIFD